MLTRVRCPESEYQAMIFAGAELESGEPENSRIVPMTKRTT
jgi:hypothetical protein